MSLAVILSEVAALSGVTALFLSLSLDRPGRAARYLRKTPMALATFALGMALFALFFGLVAACDRL